MFCKNMFAIDITMPAFIDEKKDAELSADRPAVISTVIPFITSRNNPKDIIVSGNEIIASIGFIKLLTMPNIIAAKNRPFSPE